jgi:acyl carrier protein
MEPEKILSLMKEYFALEQPERLAELEQTEQFTNIRASHLLEDSTDVVTFVFYLEDKLGREIKLHEIGPELTSMTFQDLANKLCRVASEKA